MVLPSYLISPFLLVLLPLSASSFCGVSTSPRSFAPQQQRRHFHRSTRLFSGGSAPKYDKFDGLLREAEVVAEGSVMLHVDVAPRREDDESEAPQPPPPLDYRPGHVLALEIEGEDPKSTDDNGGWMRGPYTVSRATSDSIDVLVRVVGTKSRAFASAPPNTPVRFGGKFHVPILEGIEKEKVRRVVMISTGVGVGPCVGAIESALTDPTFPPVELFASYRTRGEIVYGPHLDELADRHPEKFTWRAVVTSEVGRIAANERNLAAVVESSEARGLGLADTHYHLIGNGQMVGEWMAGLKQAGVPEDRVTIERYFNHKAEVDEKVVGDIASAISRSCVARV